MTTSFPTICFPPLCDYSFLSNLKLWLERQSHLNVNKKSRESFVMVHYDVYDRKVSIHECKIRNRTAMDRSVLCVVFDANSLHLWQKSRHHSIFILFFKKKLHVELGKGSMFLENNGGVVLLIIWVLRFWTWACSGSDSGFSLTSIKPLHSY